LDLWKKEKAINFRSRSKKNDDCETKKRKRFHQIGINDQKGRSEKKEI